MRKAKTWPNDFRQNPAFAGDYSCPFPAVFISEVRDPGVFRLSPIWLARDGWVPLVWFFCRNPKPPFSQTRILVHRDLIAVVPPAWRRNVRPYHVWSDLKRGAKMPATPRHLVFWHPVEDPAEPRRLETLLQDARRWIRERKIRVAEVSFLCTSANDPLVTGQLHRTLDAFRLVTEAFDRVGLMKMIDLQAESTLANAVVFDLGARMYRADPYVTHLCLSKGAEFAFSEVGARSSSRESRVSLSPYHGIAYDLQSPLSVPAFARRQFWRRLRSAPRATELGKRAPAGRGTPWPAWFEEWCGLEMTELTSRAIILDESFRSFR